MNALKIRKNILDYQKFKAIYKQAYDQKSPLWEFPGGVQWLGLHAFTAKGAGSIPGQGQKNTKSL